MKRCIWCLCLCAAAGLFAQPAGGASVGYRCAPTPQDGFGPFGRALPPLRTSIGTGHVLTGRVLSAPDCQPIQGAQVQFWQANRKGRYTRATSATVLTDRAGRFRLEGPYPARYEGREPHIHIRVFAPDHAPLLTRYVPGRGARGGSLRLVLELDLL